MFKKNFKSQIDKEKGFEKNLKMVFGGIYESLIHNVSFQQIRPQNINFYLRWITLTPKIIEQKQNNLFMKLESKRDCDLYSCIWITFMINKEHNNNIIKYKNC